MFVALETETGEVWVNAAQVMYFTRLTTADTVVYLVDDKSLVVSMSPEEVALALRGLVEVA